MWSLQFAHLLDKYSAVLANDVGVVLLSDHENSVKAVLGGSKEDGSPFSWTAILVNKHGFCFDDVDNSIDDEMEQESPNRRLLNGLRTVKRRIELEWWDYGEYSAMKAQHEDDGGWGA